MVFFFVDDNFAFHRKAVAAGNAAIGLWTRAGSWCGQQLTDGFVPDHMVPSLGTVGQAKRLVQVGLWERVPGGYQFWQWSEPGRQPTREQVEQKRAAARDRMRRIRGSREHPANEPENEHANNTRSSGAVRDARPVPSRPEGTGKGSVGNSSSRRNARATSDDDEDLNSKIDQRIIDALYEHTGRYVPADHAAKVRRQLLDDRPNVANPLAYVAAAIRGEPQRYMPAPAPVDRAEPWHQPRQTAEHEAAKDRGLPTVKEALTAARRRAAAARTEATDA